MNHRSNFKFTTVIALAFTCLVSNCYCCNSEGGINEVAGCFLVMVSDKISLMAHHDNGQSTYCELLPSVDEAECLGTGFYTTKRAELRDLLLMLGVLSSHKKDHKMILGCIELLKSQVESISRCRLRDGLLYHPCQLPSGGKAKLRIDPNIQLHYEKHNKIVPEELLGVLTLLYPHKVQLLFTLPERDRVSLVTPCTIGGKWIPLSRAVCLSALCILKAFFEENSHKQLPACRDLARFLHGEIKRCTDDSALLYVDRKEPSWSSKIVNLSEMLYIFSQLHLVLCSNYAPRLDQLIILASLRGYKYAHLLIWNFDSIERECMESAAKTKKEESRMKSIIVTKYFMELLLTKKQLPGLDEFAQKVISSCELRLERHRIEGLANILSAKWNYKFHIRQLVRGALNFQKMLDLRTYSDEDISTMAKFIFAILSKNQERINQHILQFRDMYAYKGELPRFNLCLAGVEYIQGIWDNYGPVGRDDTLEAIVSLFRLDEIEELKGINLLVAQKVNRLFKEYELVKSGIYQ